LYPFDKHGQSLLLALTIVRAIDHVIQPSAFSPIAFIQKNSKSTVCQYCHSMKYNLNTPSGKIKKRLLYILLVDRTAILFFFCY